MSDIDLDEVRRQFFNALYVEALIIAAEGEAAARSVTPVITGNLISTVRSEVVQNEGSIRISLRAGGMEGSGNPPKFVNYASFVEPHAGFMQRGMQTIEERVNEMPLRVGMGTVKVDVKLD